MMEGLGDVCGGALMEGQGDGVWWKVGSEARVVNNNVEYS